MGAPEVIKKYMSENGLTQRGLGMEIGESQQSIWKYLNGVCQVPVYKAYKWASIFKCRPRELNSKAVVDI